MTKSITEPRFKGTGKRAGVAGPSTKITNSGAAGKKQVVRGNSQTSKQSLNEVGAQKSTYTKGKTQGKTK